MSRTLAALLVTVLLCGSAAAQSAAQPAAPAPEPDYPVVRVGGLSYLQYAVDFDAPDTLNAFDVTRSYLNVNVQVSKNVRFRVTPDIRRVTDGSLAGSLTVRLKYGFAQFDNILPRGWIRFGLQQTPWLDFEEGINRYRVQGTMFTEREGLIPGSADFGAGVFMTVSPLAEVHAGVFNGEGFTQAEANRYKSVQARLTLRPLHGRGRANGLRVSGFVNAGWYAKDRPRHLWIGMTSYEHRHLVATAQLFRASENPTPQTPRTLERNGWSVFVEPRQGPAGWAGLLRVESLDPDDLSNRDLRRRVLGGGAYWFIWPRSRLGLVATMEHVTNQNRAVPRQQRLLLQTHIDF